MTGREVVAGRGCYCEQVRGECVNIAPGRIEKQMSNENSRNGWVRVAGGGTAAEKARTCIAG